MAPMKFREDPWLTDYINAIHFSIRVIEVQTRDRQALYRLKTETDALIQEALLGNLPMEIFTIRRLAARISEAEANITRMFLPGTQPDARPIRLKTYNGDARSLIADYRFISQGFQEFTLKGIAGECALYFPRVYPHIPDLNATIAELFDLDISAGLIYEVHPDIFRHRSTT